MPDSDPYLTYHLLTSSAPRLQPQASARGKGADQNAVDLAGKHFFGPSLGIGVVHKIGATIPLWSLCPMPLMWGKKQLNGFGNAYAHPATFRTVYAVLMPYGLKIVCG
jgi:hypothetical protein